MESARAARRDLFDDGDDARLAVERSLDELAFRFAFCAGFVGDGGLVDRSDKGCLFWRVI